MNNRKTGSIKPNNVDGQQLTYAEAIRMSIFEEMSKNEKILDYVSQLIGPDFALWNSSFFAKPPIDGHATPWHQDGQYWPIRPLATCTVWIAIDEANKQNGCLRIIRGSHKNRKLRKHNTVNDNKFTLHQMCILRQLAVSGRCFRRPAMPSRSRRRTRRSWRKTP